MKFLIILSLCILSTLTFANSNKDFKIQTDIVTGTIVIQLTNQTEQILGCEYEFTWKEDAESKIEKGYMGIGANEWTFFNFPTEFGSKISDITTSLNCEELN